MWRPPIHFITIHYAYIIGMGLLALPILYPQGNLSAIDSYFFGVSASTESGLNPVDVKDLRLYQQLFILFVPMVTNFGFINIIVVIVRLFWFKQRLRNAASTLLNARHGHGDVETGAKSTAEENEEAISTGVEAANTEVKTETVQDPQRPQARPPSAQDPSVHGDNAETDEKVDFHDPPGQRITFDPSISTKGHPKTDTTLYVPGPRDRDRGAPLLELERKLTSTKDDLEIEEIPPSRPSTSMQAQVIRRRRTDGLRMAEAKSLERAAGVASSMFVIGSENRPRYQRRQSTVSSQNRPAFNEMPFLSKEVTIGRNSQFKNLSSRDREELGGIEYRSLKLLLKIVTSYFFGMHLFGAICLVGWVQYADPKYTNYLEECGQNKNWWAFYTSQTMVDNLGFTLTPDSMVSFRDATWPMFIMSFLAFAGNTLYPVFLRLIIWTLSKLAPRRSSIQEPLAFLLTHPRRCYTLLFPSGTTWALFGIIFALNFVDTLLIIVLDLDNPAVTDLPIGPRILAAIYQAASSRHTGTAAFSLGDVSPAVQLSLLVMMYIAVFPIALSIRASNTYEEKSLGIYEGDETLDEERGGATYLMKHMQNQLSFDLWYIFLGIFCVSIAEAKRVMDPNEPAFAMFPIFFEVTSAYGNVGLSLGYPSLSTSLSGEFSTFSKVVICAMMIRGRHRGLPYQLDRAIMLPDERLVEDGSTVGSENRGGGEEAR